MKSIKKRYLSLLLVTTVFNTVQVHGQEEKMLENEIDVTRLEEKVETNVVSLAKKPEWGVTSLIANTRKTKSGIPVSHSLPTKLGDKLSPGALYDSCSKGVAMMGLYYNCGHCKYMHIDLGASVTILSEDGICLTNYHVLEDYIRPPKVADASGSQDSVAFIGTHEGKVYPITKILAYDRFSDVAIFQVDIRGDLLPFLRFGDPAKVGDPVHVISHPLKRYYYYSQGIVARNVKHDHDADEKSSSRMEITADYGKGSSGAPILDEMGNIIGMVASTTTLFSDEETKKNPQMVIKSTIPVKLIKALITSTKG